MSTGGYMDLLARALASEFPYRPEFTAGSILHPALHRYRYTLPLKRWSMVNQNEAGFARDHLLMLARERTWGLKVRHLEVLVDEDDHLGIEFVADVYRPEH